MKFESGCPLCGSNQRESQMSETFFEEASMIRQKIERAEMIIQEQDQVIHEQIKTIYDYIKKDSSTIPKKS